MENWKKIKGYGDCYFVSDIGNIKSIDKEVAHWRGGVKLMKGRELKKINRKGYFEVNLSNKGKAKAIAVHRLVAEYFIKNVENKPQVNHKNGNTTDNRVFNLEWVTQSENQLHAYSTGLQKKKFGEENHRSKLTKKEVELIRNEFSLGLTNQKTIAKKYKVSTSLISLIVNNKNWIKL